MTREEAKRRLLNIERSTSIHTREDARDFEALEMAIQALSQEPCDDAISRQAVMDCFKKWQPYMATRWYEFKKELSALPSVTQKSGKWIKGKDSYGTNHYTCPFCGHDIATKAENWDDNYCANCGAELRGAE